MKYDLDISVVEKLLRLYNGTLEMTDAAVDFAEWGESAFQPSHVADYEHWKMTNKRNKR